MDNAIKEMQIAELMNIEDRIRELESGPWVRIARQYEQIKAKRLAYLEELKQLERMGKRIHRLGWREPEEV